MQSKDAAVVSQEGLQILKGDAVVKAGEERKKMRSRRGQPKRGAASTGCAGAYLCPRSMSHFSRSLLFGGCTLVLVHCLRRSIPAWELRLLYAETICALNNRAKCD